MEKITPSCSGESEKRLYLQREGVYSIAHHIVY